MHDGGCIALDWWRDHQTAPRFAATTPIVLVLHGLSGAPLLLPYCAAHPCMQRRLHALRHYYLCVGAFSVHAEPLHTPMPA